MHLCWRLEREDSGKGEEMEEEREQCDYCDKEIRGKEEMEEHKVMCWEEVYGRRGMADQLVDQVVNHNL